MNQLEFFNAWSKLHGEAKISGIVKGWLTISYLLVKPLTKLKITPSILTIFGLIFWSTSLSKCSLKLGSNSAYAFFNLRWDRWQFGNPYWKSQ
jgi:hypothetical protein